MASTPSRLAIMAPPSTQTTSSDALIKRSNSGPPTPSPSPTPPRANLVAKRAPRHHVVKHEFIEPAHPTTPRRIMAPPTPPSTGSLVRRSRFQTPPARRRSSASTPSRARTSAVASSADFLARLAASRASKSDRRQEKMSTPRAGRFLSRTPRASRSTAHENDTDVADDEEVEFWRAGRKRGSTVDVAIEIDNDEELPPSPTPSTSNLDRDSSLIPANRQSSVTPSEVDAIGRDGRASSSLSWASLDSRGTPFEKAPTWDDSDDRYGRYYPRADKNRNPTSQSPALIQAASIPMGLVQSLNKLAEMIRPLRKRSMSAEDKMNLEDEVSLSDYEKLAAIESAFFNQGNGHDSEIVRQIKDDLASSEIRLSIQSISDLLKLFKASFIQSVQAHLAEYKHSATYKGSKDMRQSAWFSEFRTFLKFSIQTLCQEVNKPAAENVLLTFRVACNEKDQIKRIAESLNERFQDVNTTQSRQFLDAIVDLSAQVINIAWSK
ncbi:uncharacterized protein I303_107391 [Kwoniella dejecticola CBS 10117]|uniref:Uncharacterized protein n=1 Tax=Kwoniella dejecticola CBS 10117 TaxID=1296121 RepID=A0A1A5ZZJ7_9TREE|nr:uncharacterized protein I303_06795 [Kwoniella dejecticola CBS 10117]OBR83234.1 hypothetical protein I303_06795 [Kwoniella dejecticola CBS 10117]